MEGDTVVAEVMVVEEDDTNLHKARKEANASDLHISTGDVTTPKFQNLVDSITSLD